MNNKNNCPRLIEMALPISEISAEGVREKSLRFGHISTLHLWWARRPLATARAINFATLVPDPDSPYCPLEFKQAVEKYLKIQVSTILQYSDCAKNIIDKDPYKPYEGMKDTLRNRLLMFVAKWSSKYIDFEKGKTNKEPKSDEMLDNRSLVKWETSNPENHQGQEILRIASELIKIAHNGKIPLVFDPFSGGGSIPLEASRIGCQAIANDYNPVAYLILRAACEFPQKYGKPGKRKESSGEINVKNVLSYDLEKYAKQILESAKNKIGQYYPTGKDGKSIVGYLWARTAPCSNPSCRGEIPLLRSLLICDKKDKKVALTMNIDKNAKKIKFGIAKGNNINQTEGTTISRGVKCPFCDQITSSENIKAVSFEKKLDEILLTAITDGLKGKDYRPIEETDNFDFSKIKEKIKIENIPTELMPNSPDFVSGRGWNYKTWDSIFNYRQLLVMSTFIECLHETLDKIKNEVGDEDYKKAVGLYLGLWIGRIASRLSSFGVWSNTAETLGHPFGRQAIPMVWDYPEANPFSEVTGGALSQLDWIIRVIEHESNSKIPAKVFCGDSSKMPFESKSIDVIATDPPYFDAISYADLSDYFYVWLKRAIGNIVPEAFSFPLTPKTEEATALRHRHKGSLEDADKHFKNKLTQILKESHRLIKDDGVISIMFAHQSAKAWSALIHSIFEAGLTIDATWPIDTEYTTQLKKKNATLSSSVTVACRSRITGSAESFKKVKKEIEETIKESVKRFWEYGFRGADLIVACYGPAVGVFGKYERVEKADGTLVEIPELLETAKKAALEAIAGEFKGDKLSTLYFVWANLYGISEQDWDDARLIVQIGSSSDENMDSPKNYNIFVVDGSKCRLAILSDRSNLKNLGMESDASLIDMLHRAMLYWKEEKRSELIKYLSQKSLLDDAPFWKLAQALFEVLPHDLADWKLVSALLGERNTLIMEGKRAEAPKVSQGELF